MKVKVYKVDNKEYDKRSQIIHIIQVKRKSPINTNEEKEPIKFTEIEGIDDIIIE